LEFMTYDSNMKRKSVIAGMLTIALVAQSLAPAGLAAQSVNLNLPRLGDAGGDDFSPAMERRIGDSIMREIRRERGLLDDPELNQYLNQFAARLTSTSAANGYSFEFFFVPDSSMNAFALPGGYIGVHTGLMASAQSESELASVLAHEIGHVTQRHIARMLTAQRQSSAWQIASLVLAALAARSNPQAAIGAITLGMGAQQDAMLGFSRDAEREADRVGMQILREAGFDVTGMVAFFVRLQQAGRLYESQAPAYMRTHPLTTERIADMQNRVREERYRQHADSLEFRLAQAKVRALLDGSVDGLRTARQQIERRLREGSVGDELAAWYSVAVIALDQRDAAGSQRALNEVNKRLAQMKSGAGSAGSGAPGVAHPFVDRLAIDLRLLTAGPSAARVAAEGATQRWPTSAALAYRYAEALLEDKQPDLARQFLESRQQTTRSETRIWELLARAYGALGKNGAAHQATAEALALQGGWLGAIEQLQLARRANDLDFFSASQVDARLRDLQAVYQREQSEKGTPGR
jgi:beta-barrel assembly-enhancing protease